MKRTKIIPVMWIPDNHDSDWDGVPNYRDCQPFNPHKQGILHPGKVRCISCFKWFPKDEIEYYNTWVYSHTRNMPSMIKPYCKNCIGKVKRRIEKERKDERAYEKYQLEESFAEKRCPHCGSNRYKMISRDQFDKTGDTMVCLKCRQSFLRYQLPDWEMRK